MHIVRLAIIPPKKSVISINQLRYSIILSGTFDFDTSLSELVEKLLNKINPNFCLSQRGRGIEYEEREQVL